MITSDQALPAQDSYTLVLPGGVLTAARPTRRNAAGNLASLRLEATARPDADPACRWSRAWAPWRWRWAPMRMPRRWPA